MSDLLSNPALIIAQIPLIMSVIMLWSGIRHRRNSAKLTATGRPPLRRFVGQMGTQMMFNQLLLAGLAVLAYTEGVWTLESVGIKSAVSPVLAFATGAALYGVFLFLMGALFRQLGLEAQVRDAAVTSIAFILPRQPLQRRLTLFGVIAMNPLTEEFWYRGILVHQVAIGTGSITLALSLGLFANLAAHSYQGRFALVFHLPFYLLACAVVFSPLGLIGAFGMHFAGDLVPFLMFKKELKKYRQHHRKRRTVDSELAKQSSVRPDNELR